jgi:hypothetical protein
MTGDDTQKYEASNAKQHIGYDRTGEALKVDAILNNQLGMTPR